MVKKSHLFLLSLLLVLFFGWGIYAPPTQGKSVELDSFPTLKPYFEQVVHNISEFTLDNGLKFIVLENHEAPVISFVSYADVGGANEPDGKTGVAHFLEHLAFKGTKRIGTANYQQEEKILAQLDRIFPQLQEAKSRGERTRLAQLQEEFARLETEASKYVRPNEFGQIIEINGGVGLNAATSADYTLYYSSFPANKLELWMSLESERFLEPVFREFYREKQVILEERKLRTDNSAEGKMIEAFLDTAFTHHPYRRPVIGYEADLIGLTRPDVEEFFHDYYSGSNLTIAIVGDVEPKEVKRLANIYFGRFPKRVKSPSVVAQEPPQTETREVTIEYPSQPIYLEGYHIPSLNDPDYVTYDILAAILSNGRMSRLYDSLVEGQKIALAAAGYGGFPGDKYPNLMLFYAISAPDRTLDQLATALNREIERIKTEPVTEQELDRVKNQAQASLLRAVNSNLGMAQLLAQYQAKTGDWRNLFRRLEAIASITPADIQRVAQKTFVPENRTVGRLIPQTH